MRRGTSLCGFEGYKYSTKDLFGVEEQMEEESWDVSCNRAVLADICPLQVK